MRMNRVNVPRVLCALVVGMWLYLLGLCMIGMWAVHRFSSKPTMEEIVPKFRIDEDGDVSSKTPVLRRDLSVLNGGTGQPILSIFPAGVDVIWMNDWIDILKANPGTVSPDEYYYAFRKDRAIIVELGIHRDGTVRWRQYDDGKEAK